MIYHFTIQYNPGKWQHGPDSCSQHTTQPAPHHQTKYKICQIITAQPTENDIHQSKDILNSVETKLIDKIDNLNVITNTNCDSLLTWDIDYPCL